jgi:hypothetical protein
MHKAESFSCPCLSYLMMSTADSCICLTVNITPKKSSLFSCFSFFIILLDLYTYLADARFFSICNSFRPSMSIKVYINYTEKERCYRASSFDINRAAVCYFHIFSLIETCNEHSAIYFSN